MTDQGLSAADRAALLDNLTRRIASLDDRALVALDKLTRDAAKGKAGIPDKPARSGEFTPPPGPPTLLTLGTTGSRPIRDAHPTQPNLPRIRARVGRRSFLIGLFAGSLTTLSVGTLVSLGLGMASLREILPIPANATPANAPTASPFPTLNATITPELLTLIRSLQEQIAALTSERDRLLTRVGELEQSLNIATAEQNALRNQLSAINDALTKATAQVESLKVLNRLYADLDATDLDGKLVKALAELTPPLDALSTSITAVDQRTKAVETALTTVADQMPVLDASLKWLDRESKTLYANTQAFFATLEVNPQGDVKAAVTRFVDEIASSLPFTSSQSSKVALQQMGVVVTRLWETLAGLNQQVAQPLRTWIVDDQRGGLYALLLNPIRNQFIPEVKQFGTHAQSFRMIYNSSLIQSAQLTLDQRRQIRADIKQAAGANN